MQSFTNVLYHLLSNPEYVEPLRRDVETVVAEEGWTKAGMDKMHKLDSFLREAQRLTGLTICLLDYPNRISITDALLPVSSVARSCRITSIHIFQRSYSPCGYVHLCPVCCCPRGRRNLSKPNEI